MNIRTSVKTAISLLDQALGSRFLPEAREESALLCFLFHGLFERGEEVRSGVLDTQQGFTVEMFRAFLGHFCQQGYSFVSPGQILGGLQPSGKYILLTFDDGYCNNLRALPETEEEIRRTVAGYKRWKTEEVECELKKEFGKDALRPVGDLDRPFTPGELREFAEHCLVSLGNHTKNHAILTNYSLAEAREQIKGG